MGFQESSYSWRQKSKNAQKMINLLSYQSITGLCFLSLFSPNQSYQKVIITSITNLSRTRQLVRLSSNPCNFDLGRICVCTLRIHLYPDHVQWKGKRNMKCDMLITRAVIGGGWGGGGGGGETPIQTARGCSSEMVNRTPKRHQDPVCLVWLELFFTLRSTNFVTKLKIC